MVICISDSDDSESDAEPGPKPDSASASHGVKKFHGHVDDSGSESDIDLIDLVESDSESDDWQCVVKSESLAVNGDGLGSASGGTSGTVTTSRDVTVARLGVTVTVDSELPDLPVKLEPQSDFRSAALVQASYGSSINSAALSQPKKSALTVATEDMLKERFPKLRDEVVFWLNGEKGPFDSSSFCSGVEAGVDAAVCAFLAHCNRPASGVGAGAGASSGSSVSSVQVEQPTFAEELCRLSDGLVELEDLLARNMGFRTFGKFQV